MKILYCIIQGSEGKLTAAIPTISGLENQPLERISASGLTGITSNISAEKPSTDIKTLLAYQKVIDFFFAHLTLIPMRFGTVVNDVEHLVGHLADKSLYYKNLLAELAGCVEVGIRIRCPDSDPDTVVKHAVQELKKPALEIEETSGKPSGRAFLAARKAYFAGQEELSSASRGVVNLLQESLDGLYVKSKIESGRPKVAGITPGPSREAMVAINFLVKQEQLQAFKKSFQHLDAKQPGTLNLSGPWPPYNFVV